MLRPDLLCGGKKTELYQAHRDTSSNESILGNKLIWLLVCGEMRCRQRQVGHDQESVIIGSLKCLTTLEFVKLKFKCCWLLLNAFLTPARENWGWKEETVHRIPCFYNNPLLFITFKRAFRRQDPVLLKGRLEEIGGLKLRKTIAADNTEGSKNAWI